MKGVNDIAQEEKLVAPETPPRKVDISQRQQQRVNTKTKRKRPTRKPTSKQKTQ